ncbi:hypothetical protein D915_004150 [Fasciola hepatica]|uniref:Uncharacterized protein n=1 Tax=Fasciola hepatica TaxID=6192 RepID=A0A4E0RZW5_FASHE|nr:hypothetical protein D915_004150 [Fasciola hepatica]
MSSPVNVDDLSYKLLRKLAKQHGINARQKAVTLRTALKDALGLIRLLNDCTEHSGKREDKVTSVNTSTPKSNTKYSSPVHAGTHENKESLSSSRLIGESALLPGLSSRANSKSKLNTTYELTSPELISVPVESKQQFKDNADSPIKCPEAATQRAPTAVSVKRPKAAVNHFVARPIPNFSRIHARAASKMESLPQFMQRLKAVRPPFASPTYPPSQTTEAKSTSSISKVNRALSDVSNRMSHSQSEKSSENGIPGDKSVTTKPRETLQTSHLSGTYKKITTLIQKHTPKIPADSAFARRKAYDMKRNWARLSSHTPSRIPSVRTDPSNNTNRTPAQPTPMQPTKSTVPRRDLRDFRPGLNVAIQRESRRAVVQHARSEARRALANARRGF